MFKGPGKIVRDNKSSSYPVFELTGVNCIQKQPTDKTLTTNADPFETLLWKGQTKKLQ